MHLPDGIGRDGYRLLGFVTLGVGLLGLVLGFAAVLQSELGFASVGFLLAAVALGFLMTLFLMALETDAVTEEEPIPEDEYPMARDGESDDVPVVPGPAPAPVEFEYQDVEPAPKAAPEELVLPKSFQEAPPAPMASDMPADEARPVADERIEEAPETPAERFPVDDSGRYRDPKPRPVSQFTLPPHPGRQEPPARTEGVSFQVREPGQWPTPRGSHPTAGTPKPRVPEGHAKVQSVPERSHKDLGTKYTQNAPTVRSMVSEVPDDGIPLVRADKAPADVDKDWLQDGLTAGRCGGCETRILAPTARPVRLECPACGRIKLLE